MRDLCVNCYLTFLLICSLLARVEADSGSNGSLKTVKLIDRPPQVRGSAADQRQSRRNPRGGALQANSPEAAWLVHLSTRGRLSGGWTAWAVGERRVIRAWAKATRPTYRDETFQKKSCIIITSVYSVLAGLLRESETGNKGCRAGPADVGDTEVPCSVPSVKHTYLVWWLPGGYVLKIFRWARIERHGGGDRTAALMTDAVILAESHPRGGWGVWAFKVGFKADPLP